MQRERQHFGYIVYLLVRQVMAHLKHYILLDNVTLQRNG